MSTIEVTGDSHSSTLHLVYEAFVRSFSATQVRKSTFSTISKASVIVVVNPAADTSHRAFKTLSGGGFCGRIILLGALSEPWIKELGLKQNPAGVDPALFECQPAPIHDSSQSVATVRYSAHPLTDALPLKERPCCRFDFANEWNNLGYGRIEAQGPWGVSGHYQAPSENELARVADFTYVGLWEQPQRSILWWNREVGPVDSFEWTLIETYLNLPQFTEIPWGMSSAVTMRLDCDEDIQSSQPLFELYREQNVPFSLAIHTSMMSESDIPFLNTVLTAGGSILSHSHTHPENWGTQFNQAAEEARTSKQILEKALKRPISAAVSPFHKNKDYSFEALAKAQYKAVVTGIIANDPEFLLARAGAAPLPPTSTSNATLLTHSQQCMLHGDSVLLQTSDPLKTYKQAFATAAATHTLFGYLDHPFSQRYQYGWSNETQRLNMHAEFIRYLKSSGAHFLNEDDALDFLLYKTQSSVWLDDRGRPRTKLGAERAHSLTVKWNGQLSSAHEWTL